MSPDSLTWRRARGCFVALFLLLVGSPAWAQTTDSSATEMSIPTSPGERAAESIKNILKVPSSESRWHGLPRFGRDFFKDADPRFEPVEETPVGADYVLGPGDNLVVFVSGYSDTSFALTLDREGKVFLPRVGTTFLWGLSFADAETLIKARLGTVLRNTRVQVSMGRVRALEVYVLGAVVRPGKVTLLGLGTVFNAISAAGGPDPLGSMRDIRLQRGNREIARVDLYRFLLDGDRSSDARLQAGDVVLVGFASTQVGIQGSVVRPGVYESDGPMTLRALLRMAGGASSFADLNRVHIERVDANGGFRIQDLPLDHGHGVDPDSLTLSNYDLVTLMPLNERLHNAVTLDGYVRHPGEYELTPGLKLSQLISPDRLLPEAALDQAEFRRVDARSFSVELRSFSVRKVWAGEGDITLEPMDAVTIFSSARLPQSVSMEGEVIRPGTYTISPGERLSSVLRRAGGLTQQGYLPASSFLRKTAAERERTFMNEFIERQRVSLAQDQARLAQSGDTLSAAAIVQAQASLNASLARQSRPGRVVLRLDDDGRWMNSASDPALEDGDRFIVPLRPATVTVLGSVMNPGTLMARSNASFSEYVKLAGGVSNQGDLNRSYVLRANGEAVPKRSASRIQPGDAIVIPPRAVETGSMARNFAGGARFFLELATAAALVLAAVRH